jgi:hypothetical protein
MRIRPPQTPSSQNRRIFSHIHHHLSLIIPACHGPPHAVPSIHRMFTSTKPAIHAGIRDFPQRNPRKTERMCPQTRVVGVSTCAPQHLVVLSLTCTTCGANFIFTRTSGAAPVARAHTLFASLVAPIPAAFWLCRSPLHSLADRTRHYAVPLWFSGSGSRSTALHRALISQYPVSVPPASASQVLT